MRHPWRARELQKLILTKGDPSDSEMEDSAMNSLADLWHKEDDPDGEVDLLIQQQRNRYVASVHTMSADGIEGKS